MARYTINDGDIVFAQSATDALYSEICFDTIEDLLYRSSIFDVFENIEEATDVVPPDVLHNSYADIEKVKGFLLEESADDTSAQMTLKYNSQEILRISADYLDDGDDDNDDNDYDDENESFYRDLFDSEEDADEWFEGQIL